MRLAGHVLRLSVFLGEDDLWQHKPLYHDEVEVLRYEGKQP